MAKDTQKKFKTLSIGTRVTWHYRSGIGHGVIAGIYKLGTDHATTMYMIAEQDHHVGEPAIVHHYGSALRVVSKKKKK